MSANQFIRVKEAAQLLGVSIRTIHTYRALGFIKAQRLPSRTVPRYRLVRRSVFELAPTMWSPDFTNGDLEQRK